MSSGQQIIKVLAIIFAIIIIVNIFGWIIFGVSAFLGVNLIGEKIGENNSDRIEYSEVYESTTRYIKVQTGVSKLTIQGGSELKVEGRNLPGKFSSKVINGTLVVKEDGNKNIFGNSITSEIIITVPQNLTLMDLKVETGIGSNYIKNIATKQFDLDSGVGSMEIKNLTVEERTDIDGGAGKTVIKDSKLNNLDLDTGVGEVIVSSDITGNSKIDCGVGRTELNLVRPQEDYTITTKTGIGRIAIDNKKCQDNHTYGTGEYNLVVSGGVGAVDINLAKSNQF